MSNIRDMNQNNNPFWDFVASMQNNPGAYPFAEGRGQDQGHFTPFDGYFWGPFGPMPHRGRRHGPPSHDRRGSPPPPPEESHEPRGPTDGPPPPPPGHETDGRPLSRGPPHGHHGHHHGPPRHHGRGPRGPPPHDGVAPPPPPPFDEPLSRSPTPPTPPETPAEPHHHPRSHSPHRGGPHHHRGPSPRRRGPSPHHRRGGRCGGRGGRGGFGLRGGHRHGPPRGGNFPFDLNALAEAFAPGLFANDSAVARNSNNNDGTFTPDIDVFDTASAYIVHVSLPGAKKSDLDITYNPARNSVTITGVVTRPGVDEEMMSALALDERKVGTFEREIKLDENARVNDDAIAAKLEDGVLRVTVPKVLDDEEEYVTVKKVELE